MKKLIIQIIFVLGSGLFASAGVLAANFFDNGDGTVTDYDTGLTWQQGSGSSQTWESALGYCEGLSLGGKSDWRVPNTREINSIVDYTKSSTPAVDTTYFSDTTSFFWTSTTEADDASRVSVIALHWNGQYSTGLKTSTNLVRCVRGGL